MKNKYKLFLTTILTGIVVFLVGISYASGKVNPFIGLEAILKIEIGDEPVEVVKEIPLILVTKNSENFIPYMETQGYTFKEQNARLYTFEQDGERVDIYCEGFFGRYQIWYVE